MGYSLSWAAVKGANAQSVHALLQLRPKGKSEEIPESDVVGIELPRGWYLVLYNRAEIEKKVLQKLSLLGETVYCFVEDHVMFSSASGWLAGTLRWSVTHDSEKGRFHLQIEGQPPANLGGIHERLTAEQNANGGENSDTDYIYDIPAELARELVGFRPDQEVPGVTGAAFQVLDPVKRKLWGLFG